MTESSPWRTPCTLAVVCVAARLTAYLGTGYRVDDALITFRYAENLAAGNGFVYNLGERVLGSTTPLFTLLLALLKTLGLSVPTAALALSLIASGVTAWILVRFGEKAGLEKYSLIPAIIYILYPRCIISDISGLETALFTLLLVYSGYRLYTRDFQAASATAALAAVTRPEGIGLVLFVLLDAAMEGVHHYWRLLILPVLIIGSWSVFSLTYFGSLLPNSLVAKASLYHAGGNGFVSRLSEMMTTGAPLGGLLFLALVSALVWLVIMRDRLALVAAIVTGFTFILALFSPRIFFWYPAPILPLLFLVLIRALGLALRPVTWSHVSLVVMIASAAVLTPLSVKHVGRLSAEMHWYQSNHIAAGDFLSRHAQGGDKVLAEDIGYFGYHYRGGIIDRDGLVTPQAVDYNRRGAVLEFVDSVRADWLFLAVANPGSRAILETTTFIQKYEDVAATSRDPHKTHRLYRLRK